jgi:hypothetical protein
VPLGRQDGRPRAILGADALAQRIVRARSAESLDVLVLVECGDALRGELSADPVGFLGEAHGPSRAGGGERGSHAAGAAADDQHVTTHLLDAVRREPPPHGVCRVSGRAHGYDVEHVARDGGWAHAPR